MEEKKSILKNWKLWVGIVILIIILIAVIVVFALRNKMTAEETVSRFMYLIENKEYEEAKKLCSGTLEKLDIVSNLKPSKLNFKFSENKTEATSVLLEEDIETTNMNLRLKNTLMGWKIENYEVTTNLIEPQEIEDRLKDNKEVSDIQLLYWGESDIASKDEIAEYVKDNGVVALIFAETMKEQKYDKANELYQPIGKEDLTVEQLKEYNWNNYEIGDTFNIIEGPKGNFSSTTIKLEDKKVWIYVAGRQIMSVTKATT